MTDQDIKRKEALRRLEDSSGQTYLTADTAWETLAPFADDVVEGFIRQRDPYGEEADEDELDAAYSLSMALKDVQRPAAESRGIVSVYPHEMLLTYSDLSTILVEALGGEPSDTSYAGAGFTADARHDENVETLRELLDVEPAEA